LIEADVVLADGSFFTANEEAHPDLLWALRGGGGNFGVVTRFSFRLSPVSTVVAGPTLWPLDRAAEILSWYRDFIRDAPEELSGWFAFLTVPPAPPFQEHLQLQKMCGIVWCWSGDPDEAEQALGPARALGPELDGIQPMPIAALNSRSTRSIRTAISGTGGATSYPRSRTRRSRRASSTRRRCRPGSRRCTCIRSTVRRRAPAALTQRGRSATAAVLSEWTISYWETLHAYSAGGGYVNMMMEEGQDRVRAAYGSNYDRLAQVKAEYDPNNVFHVNQNIKPA